MELGIIGLGRMGLNMGTRLARRGHTPFGFDVSPAKQAEVEKNGLRWKPSVAELVNSLASPKAIWIMVPAGAPVDDTIAQLLPGLSTGDIVIDGGNSYYKDSMRRASALRDKGINYLDCGTSGGVWGLDEGYCLMIGGDADAFRRVEPIFQALAPENGYRRVGASGAGHFVKMVHNGVEYGMLQAYGEGFEILQASDFGLDLKAISSLWNQGGVVRSWLLELAERAFEDDPNLEHIAGYVDDSGEGRWTVQEAIDRNVPAPVITISLMERLRSRQKESYAAKVIAALRQQFGGHPVKKE